MALFAQLTQEAATALRLLLVLALALAAWWGIAAAFRQLTRRLDRNVPDPERRQRLKTLLSAGHSLSRVSIVLVVGLTTLAVIGVDIGPLLAGAGLVGLALSLGAQSLIKDYLGGILILAENQFGVGDVVKIGDVSGEVERISLRTTRLRDIEGRQHVLANGDIRLISNLTAQWSRAIVDLNVDYTADMNAVLRALEAAAKRAQTDEAIKDVLLEAPQALGWVALKDWAVQVRLMAKTAPGKQWGVMMALRRYAVEALAAEGVQVAQQKLPPQAG
jgi:small conductance mechanosensitive channel